MRLWHFFKTRLRRSPLHLGLSLVLGGLLSLLLHACQSSETVALSGLDETATPSSMTTVQPTSTSAQLAELPAQTQAIVPEGRAEELNPPRGDVRLVVISDLNGPYGSTDYDPEVDKGIALVPFWQPDLVLCSGDMVAGQKRTLTDPQLQAMWNAFDQHVAAPLRKAQVPYGFTMGNHDASGALAPSGSFIFDRERTVASAYWNKPAHDPGLQFIDRNDFPFYYTFKYNNIFFLAWDGSTSKIPQEQLNWVKQALDSPEAQSAEMRILLGHLPLYAVAKGRNKPGEVMDNADELRLMLEQYQVHTYISGHQHAYYPAHKGKLQLLHTGILGSGPRAYIGQNVPSSKTITVIDIQLDTPEMTTYTTYDIETLNLIEYEQLPRYLTGHNGMVKRRDIEELTVGEQAACESQLDAERCL